MRFLPGDRPFGLHWFWPVFIGLLGATVLALGVVTVAVGRERAALAHAEAAGYERPTLAGQSTLPHIVAPRGSRALIFGDSWVVGYAATPETKGFAYLVGKAEGWSTAVRGESGTGFLNPGSNLNKPHTYLQRITELPKSLDPDVILLEGGLNDTYIDYSDLPEAAAKTFAAMHERFPEATIVVVGPGEMAMPLPGGVAPVNQILAQASEKAGLHYINPIKENWFTAANFDQVIDAKKDHPTTKGHAVFAAGLEKALHQIGAPAPVG